MDPRTPWRLQFDKIGSDNRSGASELAKNCAIALISYTEQEQPTSVPEISNQVGQVAARLLEKHPSIAGLLGILNDILFGITDVETPRLAIDQIRRTCNEHIAWLEQASTLVVEQAAEAIPSQAIVLTVSYSSAVAKGLALAKELGRNPRVICLESRPMNEGRDLATFLSHAGIPVSLAVDAAAAFEVPRANLVMFGADALTEVGVVNKVGSAIVAQTATSRGIPTFAISDTSKIWPGDAPAPKIISHSADEVWTRAPKTIQIDNYYFEVVPWEIITAVVTEQGATSPATIKEQSQALRVHPTLRRLLAS